jgi:Domain of unknown function (DUF4783)
MKMQRIFLLVMIGFSSVALSQDIFAPMRAAIKAGNSDELSKHFNQNLDMNIEGNLSTFSKPQASFAMAEFFKVHPPTDFTIMHKGSSAQGGLQFSIGKYVSNKDTYTVLIRVKESNKAWLIHEISFVKEKK